MRFLKSLSEKLVQFAVDMELVKFDHHKNNGETIFELRFNFPYFNPVISSMSEREILSEYKE